MSEVPLPKPSTLCPRPSTLNLKPHTRQMLEVVQANFHAREGATLVHPTTIQFLHILPN